jgi:DNA-binding transcriptional ArsR family regulator
MLGGMSSESRLAATAALVGDPARAAMLNALMDGRALTAGELARAARITPQTASEHLAKLSAAGMLAVAKQGRHRYHTLASPQIAAMLEGILAVAPPEPRGLLVGPSDRAMRRARTCYDHFAGELAVRITDQLVAREYLELATDGAVLTPRGVGFLAELGIDLPRATPHRFCRPCLDWSERRPHVAGVVGGALCTMYLERKWLRRVTSSRAVTVTALGMREFHRSFGVEMESLREVFSDHG